MTAQGSLGPARLFVVAHNRNHVRIFADMARRVGASGRPATFVVVEGHPDRDAAADAAASLDFPVIETAQLARLATARDVVCVGNDWGPKHFIRTLERLRRRGAALVGIVEGARFAYPRHYERVDDLLCWGPSALDMLPGRKHIVGSPAIERARKAARAQPERPRVLINYKFTQGAAHEGPVWARAAAEAAAAVDPGYLLSAHHSNVADLAGLNVSHAPFSSLLADATLLITRASTVIYEALAARVSVIYFPLADERRAEFADPMGAFRLAENGADVAQFTRAHAADPTFDAAAAETFLARHVSFDPVRSASERMAAFVSGKLAEREAFDAAALPGSKPGLEQMLSRLLSRMQPAGKDSG